MEAWKDESLPFALRAEDLVSRMTLEEKVSQMTYMASALPRFGLEAYNWWNECLHGVARAGTATVFPQPIALASAFDPELISQIGRVVSDEARARYNAAQREGSCGIYQGLTFWSPNVNLLRDPRWGRGHETFGEDPILTGTLGAAYVKALQGDDPRYLKSAACAKHFAVHSGPELLRHEMDVQISKKDLWESYLPAFKMLADGGVVGFMGAYNRLFGEPCCASSMLEDILRRDWGFTGYMVSDCGAVEDFHEHHHVTEDAAESAALAVNKGCDLCCGKSFPSLLEAVKRGLISEETITASVKRLTEIRMRLGMMDDPAHVPFSAIPFEINDSEEHHELSLEAARRSMVLLKNDGLLPLEKDRLRTVAVIGPTADWRDALLGNYNGTPSETYTVLEGIKALMPEVRVLYAAGSPLTGQSSRYVPEADPFLADAMACARAADAVILCVGLDAFVEGEEGDAGDRTDLALPDCQRRLWEALETLHRPTVLVNMTGLPAILPDYPNAIIQAWYPGQFGGLAVAETVLGMNNPSGKLPVTFYKDMSQLPDFSDYNMGKGRTYRYLQTAPAYPFGFGLSYTQFEYGKLKLSAGSIAAGEDLTVRVTAKNSGSLAGREIVQLYLAAMDAENTPIRSLKGFQSVWLEPEQAMEITFVLEAADMALVGEDGKSAVRPGKYRLWVGGHNGDARSRELAGYKALTSVFTVTGKDEA